MIVNHNRFHTNFLNKFITPVLMKLKDTVHSKETKETWETDESMFIGYFPRKKGLVPDD